MVDQGFNSRSSEFVVVFLIQNYLKAIPLLENELFINIILFLLGFLFLTVGADTLVRGASRLAARFKIPHVIIGLTVVALGTSLPELVVSLIANFQDEVGSNIAIGNIVGSNIANLALILGVCGVLTAIPVERNLIRLEYPLLMAVSILFVALAWDGEINRVEGIILLMGIIGFTIYSYLAVRGQSEEEGLDDIDIADDSKLSMDILLVALGTAGLVLGANWLVDSATFLARTFGVSELVIGLTLVAIGTSLPELATTSVSLIRGQDDIAVGNIVGSNLYNIMLIGGLNSIIKPIQSPESMRWLDYPVMLGMTLLVFLLIIPKPHRVTRWQGLLLLALYFSYSAWVFIA